MNLLFYIDGQNVHHAFEKNFKIDSYYFNFRSFCTSVVKNWKNVSSIQIKYYGAIYPKELDPVKHHKDNAFYDSLEKKQNIRVRKGKFNFDRTGRNQYPPREKGVDVLLAVDLICDGFYQAYDQAIIISDDTDLIPAITTVKKLVPKLNILNLSCNPLHDFRSNCNGALHIYENAVKKFVEHLPASTDSVDMLQKKFNGNK